MPTRIWKKEQDMLKKFRRQEMTGLKKSPIEIAIERNTWFHLGANSNQQFIYSLRRMLDPIKEHVDNNFNPLPAEYIKEFAPVRQKINDLMRMSCELIETGNMTAIARYLPRQMPAKTSFQFSARSISTASST